VVVELSEARRSQNACRYQRHVVAGYPELRFPSRLTRSPVEEPAIADRRAEPLPGAPA
jgi:hypothetical protein